MEKYLKDIARFKKTKSPGALNNILRVIFSQIRKDTGWSYFRILTEYNAARKKLGINLHEYFIYRIYDSQMPAQFRSRFMSGVNRDAFLKVLNPADYILLARNKYVTKIIFKSLGIPTPEILFLYDPQAGLESTFVVNNSESAVRRLLEIKSKPFVVKVIEGSHGRDVNVYAGFGVTEDGFRAFHVSGVEHSLSQMLDFAGKGYKLLVEEKVEQTLAFSSLNQSSVNTIRMITRLHPDGTADLIAATLRVGRKGRWVDNASRGGNVMAQVNYETGRLYNINSFIDYRTSEPVTHHPDSGVSLAGFVVEDWPAIMETVLGFQRKVSWLKAIGWDIAITDSGPVVIEINDRWDLIGQVVVKEGWLDIIGGLAREWEDAFKALTDKP